MSVYMCPCVGVGCKCNTHRDQIRMSDPLEQELQAAVSCLIMDAGIKLMSSLRTVHSLNCYAITPVPVPTTGVFFAFCFDLFIFSLLKDFIL